VRCKWDKQKTKRPSNTLYATKKIQKNRSLGGVQATAAALTEALRPLLGADAVLSTDGKTSYWTVAKELGVESGSFVSAFHGKGGYGVWHVQSLNRYGTSLKTWMARFRGVATKYLPNYLGWRRLLDRFKDNLTPQQFLLHALRTSYQ
jgi:hypothetical protein